MANDNADQSQQVVDQVTIEPYTLKEIFSLIPEFDIR